MDDEELKETIRSAALHRIANIQAGLDIVARRLTGLGTSVIPEPEDMDIIIKEAERTKKLIRSLNDG